jgi:hypothetical protein
LFRVEDESCSYWYNRQQELPRGVSKLHFRAGLGQKSIKGRPPSQISDKASHPKLVLPE